MGSVGLEPLRHAVFALLGAVVLLSLVLLIYRAVSGILANQLERRDASLMRLVFSAIQGDASAADCTMLGGMSRRRVRGILLRLALDLRGEAGEAIADLYERLGFLATDLKRLQSPWAMVRAGAAADLGLVRAADALPLLLTCLEDDDCRVRRSAVWSVGQIADPGTLATLILLLGDSNRVVARRAQEVLAQAGGEVKDALLSYASLTSSRTGRLAAIELIGWLRLVDGAELLLGFMTHEDAEVRVKTVKAAAAIGDPRFLEAFHQRLADTEWEVRCQAAKGLSLFGSVESVSLLETAVRDGHWWVRFYAATALAEAGPRGVEALIKAKLDPLPQVRAMSRYLLERGEAVPALP